MVTQVREVCIVSFLAVFCLCCRPTSKHLGGKKYNLALQIKAVDSSYKGQNDYKYYYTITNEASSVFEVNEKQVEAANSSDIGLLYTIMPADSNGNAAIKITFDKFHMKLNNGGNEKDLDADNAAVSVDPVEKFLGKIKGSSIQAVVNKNGKIISVNSNKSYADSLLNSLDIPDPKMREQLKEQLSQIMGESFIKSNFENFKALDTSVSIGDSWTKTNNTAVSGMPLNVRTKYTLSSVDDGVATIEAESDITNESNNQGDAFRNVPTELKGQQKGELEVDTQTGMLLKAKSSATIKGNLQVMGREVPLTIKLKHNILGKRM
jgi:hypothetical protein